MSSAILDASALLALAQQEPGHEQVEEAVIGGAVIGAVNLSEVVAKLAEQAYSAGLLRPVTKPFSLSLGDRACLALAQQRRAPALTTGRRQAEVASAIGVTVELIR